MKQSAKTALGGIVSALSVALMCAGALLPFLTYALPAAAGLLIVFAVIEIGSKWAFGVYAAVSILSMLLVPDKEIAVLYAAFFGYYPIIKPIFETKLPKWLAWVLKLFVFNASVVCSYIVMIKLLGISFEDMGDFGKWAVPILLGGGNLAFLIYDFAVSRGVDAYFAKWRRHFKRFF